METSGSKARFRATRWEQFIAAPSPSLTPREKEIVHHVCGGLKNKEIAEALTITPGTVKVHLMHIFEKTGVKDRFELAVLGRRLLGTDLTDEAVRAKGKSA